MAVQHFPYDPWQVRETAVDLKHNQFKESVFSLGNGYLAIRGEVEEGLSASDGFEGTYLYGVFETEPVTHYWKRGGFVQESSRLVPVPRWLGISVTVDGERMDLATGTTSEYSRVLDMRTGLLRREFVWTSPGGRSVAVQSERFLSLVRDHVAAMSWRIRPLDHDARIEVRTGIDAAPRSVMTGTSPWTLLEDQTTASDEAAVLVSTARSGFHVATAVRTEVKVAQATVQPPCSQRCDGRIEIVYDLTVPAGQWLELTKLVAVTSSRETPKDQVLVACMDQLQQAKLVGYEGLRAQHIQAWEAFWQEGSAPTIEGDTASQQGANYCAFSLRQVYSGRHADLNVVCKGYAEIYGGHYFWDCEITVLPYFLYADPAMARALLMFRYNTLDHARAKAHSLRLPGALFPWYTINGREDSRLQEIHLFEIHIDAVIAWAVGQYVQATGDEEFLASYGLEMLMEIARFWAGRVYLSPRKGGRYVINGVVGPDEYTHVVNNNCFTNVMAAHALELAAVSAKQIRQNFPKEFGALAKRLGYTDAEGYLWQQISDKMYIPHEEQMGIHPQDDTFLDLQPVDATKVAQSDIPLQKHWPWDMVLRSGVIKQPDVLLLMNTLNDRFTDQQKLNNYRFYEPLCMHDSSLSAIEHSILAGELGLDEDAFKYFLRVSRLDLDDYNFNTSEGQHSTSMSGALAAIVRGFGGVRMQADGLHVSPRCPKAWKSFSFPVHYLGRKISVTASATTARLELMEGQPITITLGSKQVALKNGKPVEEKLR